MQIDLTPFYADRGAQAFSKKTSGNPSAMASQIVEKSAVQSTWQTLLSTPLTATKRMIYTHIPFCATHCTFCGFYQNPVKKHDTERYTQALLTELSRECDSPLVQATPIQAIYFGGGTPTALTADQLSRLISFYKTHFPLAPDCEITIEGRVLNFDEDKIEACLKAGANRFSIGIQTFDTTIRQSMGRYATKEQAIVFMEKLAQYNQAAVVCDLMFGLPEQTTTTWQEDLAIIQSLPVDGVDLYAINIIPTTQLAKKIAAQKIAAPSPEMVYEYYLTGLNTLYEAGFAQLSNNHWAKTTRERNLYNLLIKQGADYLAYGSGAGGRLGQYSFMLERGLEAYYQSIEQEQKPLMALMQNKHPQWAHQLQGQTETGLVHLTQLTSTPELLQPLIDQWYQTGLLTDNSLNLRFTPTGRYWARNLYNALNLILRQLHP